MIWYLLYQLLTVLEWLIIIRALVSWFVPPNSDNPLVHLLRRVTDPILRPISQMVPDLGGVDISPLVAYLALYLLQQVVLRAQFYF